jgi:8-oxo-dGTP pyrophosphatase MutT (NUDIX family)
VLETLATLRIALARRAPIDESSSGERHAAVAAIVRERDPDLGAEVLLIRRAERTSDPWSGHMAFPGGRREPTDLDLLAAACRETLEEIGLDLARDAELLGRLDEIDAVARGQRVGMRITPFVFELRGDPELTLGADEVAETLWTPLTPLFRGTARTTYPYKLGEARLDLPGYRVGERVVWGLTYQMLEALFRVVREDAELPRGR